MLRSAVSGGVVLYCQRNYNRREGPLYVTHSTECALCYILYAIALSIFWNEQHALHSWSPSFCKFVGVFLDGLLF